MVMKYRMRADSLMHYVVRMLGVRPLTIDQMIEFLSMYGVIRKLPNATDNYSNSRRLRECLSILNSYGIVRKDKFAILKYRFWHLTKDANDKYEVI